MIGDNYGLELLEAAVTRDSRCHVKKLRLEREMRTSLDEEIISSILIAGTISGIEELQLDAFEVDRRPVFAKHDIDLRPAFRALGQGVCPDLRRLSVKSAERDLCVELAGALRSGHCCRLQELKFWGGSKRMPSFEMIFEALQEGSCPNLTKIDFDTMRISHFDILALANLLRSRACPQLKSLVSSGMDLDKERVVDVIDALLRGSYSDLTHLRFGRLDRDSSPAVMALAGLLSSGRYSHLEVLCLGHPGSFIEEYDDDEQEEDNGDHPSLTRILEAVGAGHCRKLRHLGIDGEIEMDTDHVRMLGQVLRDGACPLLEELDLGGNRKLTGEGLAYLMDSV